MFCKKCGTKLVADGKFCLECGASLDEMMRSYREQEVAKRREEDMIVDGYVPRETRNEKAEWSPVGLGIPVPSFLSGQQNNPVKEEGVEEPTSANTSINKVEPSVVPVQNDEVSEVASNIPKAVEIENETEEKTAFENAEKTVKYTEDMFEANLDTATAQPQASALTEAYLDALNKKMDMLIDIVKKQNERIVALEKKTVNIEDTIKGIKIVFGE